MATLTTEQRRAIWEKIMRLSTNNKAYWCTGTD
jgi:hypothetical protein